MHDVTEFFVVEVEECVEVDAPIGELAECAALLELWSWGEDGLVGVMQWMGVSSGFTGCLLGVLDFC